MSAHELFIKRKLKKQKGKRKTQPKIFKLLHSLPLGIAARGIRMQYHVHMRFTKINLESIPSHNRPRSAPQIFIYIFVCGWAFLPIDKPYCVGPRTQEPGWYKEGPREMACFHLMHNRTLLRKESFQDWTIADGTERESFK